MAKKAPKHFEALILTNSQEGAWREIVRHPAMKGTFPEDIPRIEQSSRLRRIGSKLARLVDNERTNRVATIALLTPVVALAALAGAERIMSPHDHPAGYHGPGVTPTELPNSSVVPAAPLSVPTPAEIPSPVAPDLAPSPAD